MKLKSDTPDLFMMKIPRGLNDAFMVEIPAGKRIGFKAMPRVSFNVQQSHPNSDWNGLYPQLSLANAIGYLPNQYDRGHSEAVIYGLRTVQNLKMVIVVEDSLSLPNGSSSDKAHVAKNLIGRVVPEFNASALLLDELGRHSMILCLPDAEEFELVIPHVMFNESWFSIHELFHFRFGPLGDVKQVQSKNNLPHISKDVMGDHKELSQLLSKQIDNPLSDLVQYLEKTFGQ